MKKTQPTVKKVSLMGQGAEKQRRQNTVSPSPATLSPQEWKDEGRNTTRLIRPAMLAKLAKSSALLLLSVLALLLILFPKPQLIQYSVGSHDVESVYWPGFDGGAFEGRLLDADFSAALNEEIGVLYVCNRVGEKRTVDHCSKYKINKNRGFFASVPVLFRQKNIY